MRSSKAGSSLPTMAALVVLMAAVLVVMTVAGCHGGGPTDTFITTLGVEGSFGSLDGTATILNCRQFLDGTAGYGPTSFSPASSRFRFSIDKFNSDHGRHSLVITVVSQTHSPTAYRTTGLTATLCLKEALGGCAHTFSRIELPDQTATLENGGSIRIDFDI